MWLPHIQNATCTLSTVISLCDTIYERGLEGKHPMNSVSNTNQELTLFGYEMNSVSNINYLWEYCRENMKGEKMMGNTQEENIKEKT